MVSTWQRQLPAVIGEGQAMLAVKKLGEKIFHGGHSAKENMNEL